MDRLQALGLAVFGLSVAAYLLALRVAYPGRAFSLTGIMVGLTLVAIGRAPDD